MRCNSLFLYVSLVSAVFASPTWQEVSLSLANKVIPRAATTYTFNAKSSQNLAVYFGRTDATSNTTLQAQCNDTNVDIVILAFVTDIVGGGGYPDVSFGKLCGNRTATMRSAGATGLKSCDDLAPQIAQCQAWGKKVLVGIGGQNGNATFASTDDATKGAKMLWNVFGGGSDLNIGLRPFGNVTVDGFDIDNESGNGSFYDDFVKALRTLYSSQSTKSYYISAAPPCYFPDASQPLSMLNLVDWVWPQFYSAPSCNIGTDGFSTSFSSWSARLSGPKLYIGAPSFAAAATNGGYQDPDAFSRTIATARSVANGSNFGGVMLWDGAYAHLTQNEQGRSFVNVTKAALQS